MNIFYIITGILNIFPAIQVNSPLAVIIPTCAIMLLGVVKEFVGELKRYNEDKVVNATPVQRLAMPGSPKYAATNEIQYERTTLAELQVGDIIKIEDRE